MRRIWDDERGITLAEIVVAIAIIGIGLMALASVIPIAAYGVQEGNQLSTATFLANARLEQVQNARWACPPPAAPACSLPPAVDNIGVSTSSTAAPQSGGTTTFPDESPMAAPYAGYTRQVRITDCGVGAGCGGVVDSNLRQATVFVSYQPLTGVGQGSGPKTAVVTMLVARK
jgi:type II secretory pathway pseudopilin PulG